MSIQLHQQVAGIAQNDSAIHVSDEVLINLVTRRLERALQRFVGFYKRVPDVNPIIQIGLKSCTYDRSAANWQISLPPAGTQPGTFLLRSNVAFTATFAAAKVDDINVELFTVTLTVTSVNALGTAASGKISLLASTTVLTEDPNFAHNLLLCGLSDTQVKRLEGLVQFSVVPASCNNIFRGAPSINLNALFPMISFQDPLELDQVSGLLVIARAGAQLNETARCPCGAESPPIAVRPAPPQLNPDPTTGGKLPINVTFPLPEKQDPENTLVGQVSLYLPEVKFQAMAGGPYPAIAGYLDDNGFIGYSFDYTIAFLTSSLSLTDPRATIVLKVEFYINGHGEVNVDVPCVGRETIGRVWATNRNNPNISYVEVGFTPVLLPSGRFVIQAQLLNVFVSFFDVDVVTNIGTLLGYLAGWAGGIWWFFLDVVFARVIGQKLPFQLQDMVRNIMGHFNWTIFNVSDFDLDIVGDRLDQFMPAISRLPDSALFGISGVRR